MLVSTAELRVRGTRVPYATSRFQSLVTTVDISAHISLGAAARPRGLFIICSQFSRDTRAIQISKLPYTVSLPRTYSASLPPLTRTRHVATRVTPPPTLGHAASNQPLVDLVTPPLPRAHAALRVLSSTSCSPPLITLKATWKSGSGRQRSDSKRACGALAM